MNELIFTLDAASSLDRLVGENPPEGPVVIVTDSNIGNYVVPELQRRSSVAADATVITIEAGETHKNLDTAARVWNEMVNRGLNRRSLCIAVGGGVVTDLAGFAAATFKRGIRCINMPTTLLADVDASVGGKTGIDFMGLKNEIGVFAIPEAVIVSPQWLSTLPHKEWLSGYGEMLKHSLLSDSAVLPELDALKDMPQSGQLDAIRCSVAVKQTIVEADPRENGIRAALNLGHTAGHAIESHLMASGRPIPHGAAVAFGIVTALVLSRMKRGMMPDRLYSTAQLVRDIYGQWPVSCKEYDALLRLMHHDKKNTGQAVRFALLDAPGHPVTGIEIPDDDIRAAFDITCDLLG